ncbi:hypothetical protein IF650_01145 [Cellulosimicrobium terreum]|nr:hypothetical protein [Cellulosimicrobium terreum]
MSALVALSLFVPTAAWAADPSNPSDAPAGTESPAPADPIEPTTPGDDTRPTSEPTTEPTTEPTSPADTANPGTDEPGPTGGPDPSAGAPLTEVDDAPDPAAAQTPSAGSAPTENAPTVAPTAAAPTPPEHVGDVSGRPEVTPAVGVVAAIAPLPPDAASDGALIAWIGDVEPDTKITLAAALSGVPDGGTVGITPGAYKFTSQLQVQRGTTIVAASPSTVYGRILVNAGSLSTTNLTLSPYARSQSVVTVANTAVGVQLPDLVVTNTTSDGTTPLTGTVAINLGSSVGTQVLRPVITDVATAIGLAGSASARIEDASVSGVTTGASITAGNANVGPAFVGGSMTVTGGGISLGTTSAPSVSGMSFTGGGAGTAVNVHLATSATVTGTTVDGFATGVLLAAAHAGAGPTLTASSIGASLTGIDLGASSGASLSEMVVRRTGAGTAASNSTGVNLRRASGVEVVDSTEVSGFARGIHADDASEAAGPQISDATVSARVIGINLGATVAPSVTDTGVQGEGATGITDGIRVLMAQDATVARVTVSGFTRGIYVDGNNTGAGPTISDSTIGIVNIKAFGIALGATTGATVTDVDVTGTGELPQTGITVARAPGAVVTDARVSGVTVGIGATRADPDLGLPPIAGPQIIRPVVTDSGSGVQVASSVGAQIVDADLDVRGDGINGWEAVDAVITRAHITGVAGPGPTAGTNSIRFYTSRGVAVNDAVLVGGASGLYWDMTYDAVVDGADVSGMEWYASYTEGVTGYELRDSAVHDNAAIANLTINPSDVPVNNLRQVSSDIRWHDNTFTANPAGIYLPQGVTDVDFRRNTVTGSDRYVILATPVHGMVVEDNDIDFAPAVPTASALSVTTFWEDLDEPGSYSSSDLAVTGNRFTGTGPFVRVGAVESVPDATPVSIELMPADPPDPATPSEPSPEPDPDPEPVGLERAGSVRAALGPFAILQVPEDRRAVRTTIDVSSNSFPTDSVAIVTLPNAEAGEDTNTENEMIDGVVAVDAREETQPGQNDWGSACGPRVAATGYDGGGAFITEERTTQVLYPELCTTQPSVVVAADAVCRADVGYLDYDIRMSGVPADPTPVVAAIWWSTDAYPERDATIAAADEDAILADGADAVQYVPVPPGWQPDDPLTGELEVAPALVDTDGTATRAEWVLEVRVNPSAAILVDPPDGLEVCPTDGPVPPPAPPPAPVPPLVPPGESDEPVPPVAAVPVPPGAADLAASGWAVPPAALLAAGLLVALGGALLLLTSLGERARRTTRNDRVTR